ncbi:MAG: hypothetical protein RLZZ546_3203 [Bacteroidota bacterium]
MQDLIINFTPTGMVPTKAMNPKIPISIQEIIENTLEANELGITLVHLHARDENGEATYKKEIYGKIMDGIKKYAPDLVLCLSLSGRNFNEFSKRSEAIELKPDMGSLTLSSLNFPKQASVNDPEMISSLANKMKNYGVNPELEIFDLGMINFGQYLIDKGILTGPYYFNIILGNIAGLQMNIMSISAALTSLPNEAFWALGGIGQFQLQANSIAIALGGGVRVGLEDNLFYDKNKTLTSNISLLKRIHTLAEIHERKVMSPSAFGSLGFYNKHRSI